jgi:hypothetical protein
MNADLSLIVTNFACYFRKLSSKLSLFLEEISADIHFGAFHKLKFVILLQNIGTDLSDIEHLIIINVKLLPYHRGGYSKFLSATFGHSMNLTVSISY